MLDLLTCLAPHGAQPQTASHRLALPVGAVQSPEPPGTKLQKQVIAGSARAKLAEKLRSRKLAGQELAARARTSTWAEAVEKLRSKQAALKEQAAAVSRPDPAEPMRAHAALSGPPTKLIVLNTPPHLRAARSKLSSETADGPLRAKGI